MSSKIKGVFFDFMGTCLDWHTSVVQSSPNAIPQAQISKLALEWRQEYFVEINKRFQQNIEPEDIDKTLARTLETILAQYTELSSHFDPEAKEKMVQAWHSQAAWPEVKQAIQTLRKDLGLEVFVQANGTTRLQLDLVRSSGLEFDMLFSSQLLGCYKPSPDAYRKALELVGLKPEEVVMVAAHAYDLRGAQKCGMKVVYIHRWTDDVDEDMEKVKNEVDAFLENMEDLPRTIAGL